MRKSKGVYGAHFVRGNGFVVARAQKGRASSKSFLHWAEDNFRHDPFPSLSFPSLGCTATWLMRSLSSVMDQLLSIDVSTDEASLRCLAAMYVR